MINNKIIYGVIPSRYGSTRLPGKPLADINGRPMIWYVYQACLKSKLLDKVIVATDDKRVYDAVKDFGGSVILTDKKINTGTDRCFQAVLKEEIKPFYVVNIQGDEPLIEPSLIDECLQILHNDKESVVSTPVKIFTDQKQIADQNKVKVILNKKNQAIYFSRSAIPFVRINREINFYQHIGLYVFKYDFLKKFVKMEQTPLEQVESLEQLRIIENDYKISCCFTEYNALGVDTSEDLEKVRMILK